MLFVDGVGNDFVGVDSYHNAVMLILMSLLLLSFVLMLVLIIMEAIAGPFISPLGRNRCSIRSCCCSNDGPSSIVVLTVGVSVAAAPGASGLLLSMMPMQWVQTGEPR